MDNAAMDLLYKKYHDKLLEAYAEAEAAMADGFQLEDVDVFIKVIEKMYNLYDDKFGMMELADKKLFIHYIIDRIYEEKKKMLPWYVRMIPFTSKIIKGRIMKYVDKALEFLYKEDRVTPVE